MKAYNKYEVDEIFSSWQSDLDRLDVIEVYTKSDMLAMLTELMTEIYEQRVKVEDYVDNGVNIGIGMVANMVQVKIDKLKGC